jgi:hypothetical protein
MPLQPRDSVHKEQIKAGTIGRLKGHKFELKLTEILDSVYFSGNLSLGQRNHIVTGNPAIELIKYISQSEKISKINKVRAWWLGGLATVREKGLIESEPQASMEKSKSDILLEITCGDGQTIKRGISVKTCDKATPTNDQLFLTTAVGFCNLLRNHELKISKEAETALRMFCGDEGYRPMDLCSKESLRKRKSDPERHFWEELPINGKRELEKLFAENQKLITAILLQKAYPNDPYPPEYIMHQRCRCSEINEFPLAIFRIDELIDFSSKYAGFYKKTYQVHKGRYKNDPNTHEAPRFGFIQFQRFGNVQNATELQFNLKAGYFDLVSDLEKRKNASGLYKYLETD